MMRLIILSLLLSGGLVARAGTIIVSNAEELHAAAKQAQPGDIIILKNGTWKDVQMELSSNGTKEKPITFKAQTAGKVVITGHSSLRLGGKYLIVDGLHFTNGYAGDEAVISFRINKDLLASHCRVTNTVIDDFNNPGRMQENYWIAFYGKNNRLDHCSFRDKKNMGVLLAVILDDERSRENFHSIDHNYFGRRPVLASNGGEIIRVGVSQHAQFNSNTQIFQNYFEHCDGETEIVSIKSGSNTVRDNVFKESQGSVVLRHGDNNIVHNNLFLGNDKPGTGGVRIINKGQKVSNNTFYRCRGVDFRSPLAIMNGIPNSPAHRYVQVLNARISDNIFIECTPVTFGEGSDEERTLAPDSVYFTRNMFYNTRDSFIYKAYDQINGFRFDGNKIIGTVPQIINTPGFARVTPRPLLVPLVRNNYSLPKSALSFEQLTKLGAGTKWFTNKPAPVTKRPVILCPTDQEVYAALGKHKNVELVLTGTDYIFHRPLVIEGDVKMGTRQKAYISFHTLRLLSLFEVKGKGRLHLQGLLLDGNDMKSGQFIANDSSGPSGHFNVLVEKCSFRLFNRIYGCENIIQVWKHGIADSIVLTKNYFENNAVNILALNKETDNKGYYNAEKIRIDNNIFINHVGMIADIYRGGNDESTMGPELDVSENTFDNCNTPDETPLFKLTGVQRSKFFFNSFAGSNPGKKLVSYHDIVRARHMFARNILNRSGTLEINQFVTEERNTIQ